MLDFDVNDLANNECSKDLGDDGRHAHLFAQVRGPQRLDVVGLRIEHEAEQGERQNNGVHPAGPGYKQIGDTLYAWLKFHAAR